MRRAKCEMFKVHHTDCTCEWCRRHLDEECAEPAVAISGRVRICEECAVAMHGAGFEVVYDDTRLGVAS